MLPDVASTVLRPIPAEHPVERELRASALDILEALQHGFRAKADIKGKLAERFFAKELDAAERRGEIRGYRWLDEDGQPDFLVECLDGTVKRAEVKNCRVDIQKRGTKVWAETQKTRTSKRDPDSRFYRPDQWDFLALCLFNLREEWTFVYCSVKDLIRDVAKPQFIAVSQVYSGPQGTPIPWKDALTEVLT